MKKRLLVIIALLLVLFVEAQQDTTAYPYKRFPTVPPISLMQSDSSLLTKDKIKKGPVVLMYFSPSCDHCQRQIREMMARIDDFKHVEFVFATYQPFEEMVAFIKEYKLDEHNNIKVGRDTKFTLPPFFHIQSLPFLALYNKKGALITTFQGNVGVDTMLKAFENEPAPATPRGT